MISYSDALPVQFWPSYCDTFNESEVCGIHDICWCQPWNYDDDIVLQFTDSEPLYLVVLNSDEEIIHEDSFTRSNGVNRYVLTPSDINIESEQIYLVVYKNPSQKITDPEFTSGTNWDLGSSPGTWTISGGRAVRNESNDAGFTSSQLTTDFVDTSNPYRLKISARARELSSAAQGMSADLYFVTTKDGVEVDRFTNSIAFSGSGTNSESFTLDFYGTEPIDSVYLYYVVESNPLGVQVQFEIFSVYLYEYSDSLKSDCLDIKTFHNCTKLIEYSNNRNFAGLNSDNVSPDESFYIRVPCRFFHQRFPEEDDALELTDQIVVTRSQLKAQKLLEVIHAPYYFHRKLKLILMHRNIEIDNTLWKKEESFEILEGNKRWPLKAATCYLTEKNSVVRNVM